MEWIWNKISVNLCFWPYSLLAICASCILWSGDNGLATTPNSATLLCPYFPSLTTLLIAIHLLHIKKPHLPQPSNSLSKNSTTPLLPSSKPQPLHPLFITAYSQPANAATPPPPPPPITHSSPPDDKPRHAYTATSHNLPKCRLPTHDTATRINTFLRLDLVSFIEV